jgi:hypothetical protein
MVGMVARIISVSLLREKITIKNQQRKYPINLELASQISHKLYDILEVS